VRLGPHRRRRLSILQVGHDLYHHLRLRRLYLYPP
jgi:hypothetical protein